MDTRARASDRKCILLDNNVFTADSSGWPHIRLDLAKPAIHSLLGCCGKDCGRIASLAVRHRQLIYLKRRAEAAESVSDIGSS